MCFGQAGVPSSRIHPRNRTLNRAQPLFSESRPLRLSPAQDGGLVALFRPALGALAREAEPSHEMPDGARPVRDFVRVADEARDAFQRPQLRGVSLLLGAVEDGFRKRCFLLWRQFRGSPLRLRREGSLLPAAFPVPRRGDCDAELPRDEVRRLFNIE